MRRGARPARARVERKGSGRRKPAQHEGSTVERLQKRLAEARARQAATTAILRAISQSQTDPQRAFDAIADSAMQLFDADGHGVPPRR
jgi:hypothetical protein